MSQKLGPGCLFITYGFGILIGLGIVFGGVALLWQVPAAWKEMHEIWSPAPGKIISVGISTREVETGNKNYHSTLYAVVLDCVYTVEGRELNCRDSPAPRQADQAGNLEQAEAVAHTYKPGDAITVYYNPNETTKGRLDERGPNGMFWVGILSGPLLILSGLGLCAWCWRDWRRAAAS